ncbi:MAG: amino acid permease [Venatoribacter sp.]
MSELQRHLKPRHLSMIAIGGSIGTGLFVASGATIAQAGPAGALLSYALIGLMVYFLMTSLGELAAFMPTSGSFATYGANYVEPGFGFALGWNYWYNWAVTVAVDLVAAQLVMGYWFPEVSGWIWSAVFLGVIFGLNYMSVKSYGEAEYWFALIKVATVIVFIVTGTLMIFGILSGEASLGANIGLDNWFIGDAPFVGGLPAMIGVAMIVGFSFQGTELIGIAAGESQNPSKAIPSAVKQVFWRILLFYVFAILVISLIIPYNSPLLLSNELSDISVSPFTLVFQNAGLAFAAAVMNAVILTSVLSAGSSGMYASTRMLYALAAEGKAPKFFAKLSDNGVPRNALFATTAVAALCFLSYLFGENTVYLWLLNASGMTGFIAWLGIAISHYRFRQGFLAQGRSLNDLPYVSGFFPYGPIFAFVLCLIITLGQYYEQAMTGQFVLGEFIATYIGLIIFALIWGGYRLVKKSKFIAYQEMKFPSNLPS